ncbi:GNAT family N-acetyltransferase [Vulgatibacter incomptus]|uniref:Acetyltransferase, GNAT family n=1 Tax=Vulgatibacter incomptus TaxID=1391653 RepID=A0A0K1PC91_9BACT|nr:GNAT family N-acetyltransferase [Vulgatibacter incomptus]AKU91140.1 Acetyltransferase, GNAT family [Vulgatibacter incomptus]
MVELRAVTREDIERFFEHQLDSTANWMAASTSSDPADRATFEARWERNLGEPTIIIRTIVHRGEAVGYVATFLRNDSREVAYWLGRAHWGHGIATDALERFLTELQERPLHARVVQDNVASLRVLEKCGFQPVGRDRFFSRARGCEVDEVVLALGPSAISP